MCFHVRPTRSAANSHYFRESCTKYAAVPKKNSVQAFGARRILFRGKSVLKEGTCFLGSVRNHPFLMHLLKKSAGIWDFLLTVGIGFAL